MVRTQLDVQTEGEQRHRTGACMMAEMQQGGALLRLTLLDETLVVSAAVEKAAS